MTSMLPWTIVFSGMALDRVHGEVTLDGVVTLEVVTLGSSSSCSGSDSPWGKLLME